PDVGVDVEPLRPEAVRQGVADIGVFSGDDAGQRFEDRHPHAEPREHLGQLQTDSAPADHDERFGKPLQRHRRRVVQVPGFGETWDPGCPGRGARGHHDLARRERTTTRKSNLATGDERSALLEQRDGRVGPQHVPVLRLPQLGHERILLGAYGRPIGLPISRGDSPKSVVDPAVLCLGGADERLRRHTADVHAGPTERAAFDHGDPGAEARTFDGSGKPRGAAPHDQEVELAAGLSDLSRNVDQFSRLSHWLPPGAFVVSVRMVAPKPVSFVRCAAICAGLTCRGSYRTTPRLSSNVTLALYTPFSRFKASRAVVGQLPHVIFEMCSRTVAVSGLWAAMPRVCTLAPTIPPPHSGHKKAAPVSPAATRSPDLADDNMVNLLRGEPASPTSPNPVRSRCFGVERQSAMGNVLVE